MAERGIGNDDRVIVYDTVGLSSAGRAWWMLRLFGHHNVALLDGGLPKWKAEGRPLDNRGADTRRAAASPPASTPRWCATRRRCSTIWRRAREQVVDARAAGRFDGTAEETWPGLRRGHIPGSRNLPFDRVTDPQTQRLRSAEELASLFREPGSRSTGRS